MNIGYEAKRVFHNKTGLGNYSRDLVRMIATFYPTTKLFLYNPKEAKKELFKNNQVNITERRPNSHFKNYWRQKGVVKDLLADKIAVFHGLSGEIPSGLRKHNIKSVVTIHDLIFMRYPKLYNFIDRKIYYWKFKYPAKKADLIIAISEQTSMIVKIIYIDVASRILCLYYHSIFILKL